MVGATPVVQSVSVATTWDPYLSIHALAAYSSLSERLLRSFLAVSDHPLPHFRIGGRVLVRRSDFDAWLEVYREPAESRDADDIVRSMMGLTEPLMDAHRPPRVPPRIARRA